MASETTHFFEDFWSGLLFVFEWGKEHFMVSAGSISAALAVVFMLRAMLYRSTLRKLDAAKQRLFLKSPAERGGVPWEHVTAEMIFIEAHVWPWWGRWALNWKSDKKQGLV
jgi:hypothetical protein